MRNQSFVRKALPLLGVLLSITPVAQGQGLLEEQGEVTGLAGGLLGGGGAGLAFGGGGYGAVSDRWAVGGEVVFSPGHGGTNTISSGGGDVFSSSVDSSALEAHGGVQYLLSASEKSQPYLAGGIGVMRFSVDGTATVVGQQYDSSVSGSAFLIHVGGGLRYWVGERWGVKPEVKLFLGDLTAARVSVGLFYQFGE